MYSGFPDSHRSYHAKRCISNGCVGGAEAETGELVLKQQEQLAALARQQRKHLASSPSLPAPQHALDDMPVDKMADKHNDIATEDTANKPAEEPVVTSEVSLQSSLLPHWPVCPSSSMLTLLDISSKLGFHP